MGKGGRSDWGLPPFIVIIGMLILLMKEAVADFCGGEVTCCVSEESGGFWTR